MAARPRPSPSSAPEEISADRQFRRLAEAIPQLVWTTRDDGACDYVNRRFLDFTGMTADEAIGLGWLRAIHPDDRDECLARWRAAVLDGRPFEMEFRLRRPDGVDRWFLSRAEPMLDDEDRPVKWFGTATDIDDRKRAADQALRDQERRCLRIVETAHDGIWEVDPSGSTRFANARMAAMLGVEPDEMLGRSCLDFAFDEDRAEALAQLDLRSRGDRRSFEFRWRRADGSELWTLASCSPITDAEGRYVGSVGVFTDITDRRRDERRIRESEQRFRTSVETLIDCFGIFTAIRDDAGQIVDFRVDFLNQAACRNNRMSLDEQLGRGLLQLLPSHRETGLFEAYCRVVETGAPFDRIMQAFEDDYAGTREARWFDIRASKLGDGFVAAWRDVTDRKRDEEDVRRSAPLFRRLAESNVVGVGFGDSRGNITYVNDEMLRMMGHTRGDFEAGRVDWSASVAPEYREGLPAFFDQLRREGRTAIYERAFLRPDGGRTPYIGAAALTPGEDVHVSVAIDVSVQQRSDEALRQSERRFRQLADSMPHVVWTARANGSVDYYNVRVLGLAGATQDPETGLWSWSPLLHEDDRAPTIEAWRLAIETGSPYEAKHRVRMADGSYRWHLSRAFPVRDESGRVTRWYGSATDIHALAEADRTVRQSERFTRRVLDNLFAFVGVLELDGTLIEANEAPLRAAGITIDDVRGRKFWDCPWWNYSGAVQDRIQDSCARAARGETVRFDVAVRMADDSRMMIDFQVAPLRDDSGRITHLIPSAVDITDRHRAELGRQQSEDRLRLALRAAQAGTFDIDLAPGVSPVVTDGVRQLFGFAPDERPQIPDFLRRVHPDDRERVAEAIRRSVERADGHDVEYRIVRPDGGESWVASRAEPVIGADGQPVRLVGALHDVTGRRRAEEALVEHRELLRSIIDNAEAAIFAKDLDGRFILSNRRHAELLGMDADTVVGLTDSEIGLSASSAETYRANDLAVIESSGPIEFEETVTTVLGDRVFLSLKFPLRDASGRIHALCGIATDVTRRKRAERALREAAERHRLITLATNDLIWDWDLTTDRLEWSPAALPLLGCPPEQLGSTVQGWYDRIHPDDLDRVVTAIHRAIDSGEETWGDEYRFRREDGSYATFLDRGYIARDDSGRPVRMIGSMLDLTDRRVAEEALARAKQQAEDANRAKSEFLANMSHELRTPMTAILGYADVLARQATDPDDLQCVDTIRRNGRHLLNLINDILDLSRIEAGRLQVDRRRFPIDRLVADVRSLMDVRAREKGLALRVEYPDPLPESIESDPTRLRQILVNLIGNAIKFTEEGEVRIVVRPEHRPDGPLLHFEVIDTGIGISAEQQERLFQAFSQADSSMTRLYGGSGLGLAISRRLVGLLGGRIDVQSDHGRGSRFHFTISPGSLAGVPMIRPPVAIENRESPGPEGPPRRLECLVLVVDDRPDIRSLVRMFLEDSGARVETADDGQAAIEAIGRAEASGSPFDVIVMDMQMPRLDGYDAVGRLRRSGFTRPVLALTASAMRGDRERCLQAGCTDYLPKPIDHQRLVELVGRLSRTDAIPKPETHDRPGSSTPEADSSTPLREGRRVLLVDDSEDIRRVTARLLQWSGHEVETAGDGRSALELASSFRPDVVLIDLGLPDIPGLDLISRIRQADGVSSALFIAVTGRDAPEDLERTRLAGFDHHVVKPVDLDALVALFPEPSPPKEHGTDDPGGSP